MLMSWHVSGSVAFCLTKQKLMDLARYVLISRSAIYNILTIMIIIIMNFIHKALFLAMLKSALQRRDTIR